LKANVERLKAYRSRVIIFPRKSKAPKAGDASAEEAAKAKEAAHDGHVKLNHQAFPISNKVTIQEGKVSDYPSEEAAYRKLRDARSEARLVGKREKRAKAKAEEAEASKK
jgi:large subunit ribosomal protein L13e